MMVRVSVTGRVGLSVNPAAKEISPGRSRPYRMSHEMGGSVVRLASCESALTGRRAWDKPDLCAREFQDILDERT